MDKYYTPEISEFYVGFEFEFGDKATEGTSTEWDTYIISNEDSLYMWLKDPLEKRVKYLDKEDIESLGFKLLEPYKDKNQKLYFKDNITICYRHKEHILGMITTDPSKNDYYSEYNKDPYSIHSIIIKNKSELIKLLKQLRIE